MGERIVAAMSGGVDSSVAAAILREAGHDVVGVTMRLLPAADVGDVRAVAEKLGFPHEVMDLRDEFRRAVVEPFLAAYAAGRTPLPCAACNHALKFGALLRRAGELGATAVATGHYARVEPGEGGRWRLRRARDASRDQSYFLYGITPERLSHIRFPLGEMTKDDVRAKARALGLANAEKPDSQEICFIPGGDTAGYLREKLGEKPGAIVDTAGRKVGEHSGVHFYTIGQRRGLNLQGTEPRHVVAVNAATNTVIVGSEDDLLSSGCEVEGVNWIAAPRTGSVGVKIRSRHGPVPATVTPGVEGRVTVRFAEPQRSVTPGQAAVFYAGDDLLGGGTIASAVR